MEIPLIVVRSAGREKIANRSEHSFTRRLVLVGAHKEKAVGPVIDGFFLEGLIHRGFRQKSQQEFHTNFSFFLKPYPATDENNH